MILASGYYAAFRVTLVAKALEGTYDGAIHITTDYEVGNQSNLLFFASILFSVDVIFYALPLRY